MNTTVFHYRSSADGTEAKLTINPCTQHDISYGISTSRQMLKCIYTNLYQ